MGNRIFVGLIARFGVFPAYLLLIPVCLHYAFFDRQSASAIRTYRARLGLRTGRRHLFRHFLSFGMSLVDRLGFLIHGSTPFACTVEGREYFDQALRENRGLILISAHVGNWELAGNLLGSGPGVPPINFLMHDAERADLKRIYARALDNRRVKVIFAGSDGLSVALALRQALTNREIVCLHGDRALDSRTLSVPFLGNAARFPEGPLLLSARLNVPLVPIFTVRQSIGRYVVVVRPPLETRKVSDPTRTMASAMAEYVAGLEEIVRRYPYEWHNFFDFWR